MIQVEPICNDMFHQYIEQPVQTRISKIYKIEAFHANVCNCVNSVNMQIYKAFLTVTLYLIQSFQKLEAENFFGITWPTPLVSVMHEPTVPDA
jgi:hypothetical protein